MRPHSTPASNIKKVAWRGCFTLLLLLTTSRNFAQLSIDQCYTLARANYPLAKQYALIEKTKEFTVDNISKGWLPQLNVNGQASYQSAVTQVPISLPNVVIPVISKDQYKVYADVYQPLTEGYSIKQQKALAAANAANQAEQLEVELYKLRERINQLFFGILLLDLQLQQTTLLQADISNGIAKVTAAINNGTALKSTAAVLQAELLQTKQRSIELKASRNEYAAMLTLFIGQQVNDSTTLVMPAPVAVTKEINRPELRWYQTQKNNLFMQEKLITVKTLPRAGIFAQGGYGKPGLNMLSNEFAGYYIGGLRLNWSISSMYTAKKEKAILKINESAVDLQKSTFIFNTNLTLVQAQNELRKYEELIATDRQIVELRTSVKSTAGSQLQNGTITAIDYLSYVNAEDRSRQGLLLHNVQLLMAQYNVQTISGN